MAAATDDFSDDGEASIGSYSGGTPLSVASTDSEEQWGHEYGMRTYGYIVSFQRDQFGFISWRRRKEKGDVFFAEYVEHNLESGELVEFEAFWNETREMWNGKRVRRARMTRGHYARKGVVRAMGSDGLMHEFSYDAKSLQNDGFYCRNLAEGKLEPETPVVFFLERDANGDERVRLLCVVERGELKKFYDHKNCGFLRWSQSKDEDKHSDPFFWCSYSGVEAVRHFFNCSIPFHFAPVKTARGRPEALYCFAESLGTVSEISLKEDYLELSWFPQSKTDSDLAMNIRVDVDDLPEEIDLHGIRIGDQIRFDYYFARAIVVFKEFIVQGKADGFPNQRALKLKLDAAPSVVSYEEAVVEGDYEVMTGDKLKVTLICLPPEICDTVLVMKLVIDMSDAKKRQRKKKAVASGSVNIQKKSQPQAISARSKISKEQQLQTQTPQPPLSPSSQHQQFRNGDEPRPDTHQAQTNDPNFQSLLQQQVQSPLLTAFPSLSMPQGLSQSPALGASEFTMSPQLGQGIQSPQLGQNLQPLPFDAAPQNTSQQQGIQIMNFLGNKGNIFSGTMFNDFFDATQQQQQQQSSRMLQTLNSKGNNNANSSSNTPLVYQPQSSVHNQILNDMNSLLQSPQAEDTQNPQRPHKNGIHAPNTSSDGSRGEKHISEDLTMYNIPLGNDQYSQIFKGQLIEQGVMTDVAVKCVSKSYIDQAFRSEMKVLMERLMNTDHMIHIKCTREDNHNYYIVMEYCESLSEKMVQSMDDSEKLRLVNELIQAVSFFHGVQLVHRAIRPSNVMLTSNLKLKLAGDVISRSASTDKIMANGITARWNAREVIAGDTFRAASDIFSLGLMVFYILSGGKHPFQVPNMNSLEPVQTNIMKGSPPMLHEEKKQLDKYFPGTTNLISAMLQADPKWRPDIGRIRKHPLAWTLTQYTQYLEQLNTLWNQDVTFASKINQAMNEDGHVIETPWTKGHSWYDQLPDNIKKEFLMPLEKDRANSDGVVEVSSRLGAANQKPPRYNINNCTDLVRFIHNANKYLEQQQRQKHITEHLMVEFLKRYPNLIHYTYSILLEYQRDLRNCLMRVESIVGAPLESARRVVSPVNDLTKGLKESIMNAGTGIESLSVNPDQWPLRRASPL